MEATQITHTTRGFLREKNGEKRFNLLRGQSDVESGLVLGERGGGVEAPQSMKMSLGWKVSAENIIAISSLLVIFCFVKSVF